MKVGDEVYPSKENPIKFQKRTLFPWKVAKFFSPFGVVLLRPTRNGTVRREKWHISFWATEKPEDCLHSKHNKKEGKD